MFKLKESGVRVIGLLAAAISLVSVWLTTFSATPVQADHGPEPRWINISTIEYDGQRYVDLHWGTEAIFVPANAASSYPWGDAGASIEGRCGIYLEAPNINPKNIGSITSSSAAQVTIHAPADDCATSPANRSYAPIENHSISDPGNAREFLYRASPTSYSTYYSVGDAGTFGQGNIAYLIGTYTEDSANPGTFIYDSDNSGGNYAFIDSISGNSGVWHFVDPGGGDNGTATVQLAADNTNVPTGGGGGAGGTAAQQQPSCASNGGGLAWLACPAAELMLNAINELAQWLSSLLQVSPLQTDGAAYTVWTSVRNIALALFVIAVIVVIFGQTIGIDAYTIKRSVPRIGVAAVGILLSFYVSAFLIDLFNVLGMGMYTLMTEALGDLSMGNTVEDRLAEWAALVGVVGGAGAVGAASIFGLISYSTFGLFVMILVPILLAFLTGFAVIIVRQVIIIMLVIVSPLAIAAWVLPNTDQWFKRWWKLFTTLLMMYPIVMVLLGAGTLFAVIVTNGEGSITESTFINHLIALAALAFTVGLIPFTLRTSSSLMGKIAGVVNNPNRGPIDRLRKAGQERNEQRRNFRQENAKAALVAGDNRLRTRFRAGTLWRGRGIEGQLNRTDMTSDALTPEQRLAQTQLKRRKTDLSAMPEQVELENLKVDLAAQNVNLQMENLQNQQRKLEIDAQINYHVNHNTEPGQLIAEASDGALPETQRVAAALRLSQIADRDSLAGALEGMVASGRLDLAQETVNRDFGNINTFAPEQTGYVTGANAPDLSRITRKGAHNIGAVSPQSIDATLDSADPAHITHVIEQYVQAKFDRKDRNSQVNQRIETMVTGILTDPAYGTPAQRRAVLDLQADPTGRGGRIVDEAQRLREPLP